MSPFTYPEVGATEQGATPAGYRHLRVRTRLGAASELPAAAEAVMSWQMHRRVGIQVDTTTERAAPGVRVVQRLGIGPLGIAAPCQVIWTVEEPDRVGFGYGTLLGHPARGEESFIVSRDGDGFAWLTVTSFSLPARWFVRLAGPVVPPLQRAFARRCGQVLRPRRR